MTQSSLPAPDLSHRPFTCTASHEFPAPPAVLYRAWTEQFDRWFALPGSVLMSPAVDRPFFFEAGAANARYPHYGRFLRLEPDRCVELTWVTGVGGTSGAETVVTVNLEPSGNGTTHLSLQHAGFADEAAMRQHADAWPHVLAQLQARLPTLEDGAYLEKE